MPELVLVYIAQLRESVPTTSPAIHLFRDGRQELANDPQAHAQCAGTAAVRRASYDHRIKQAIIETGDPNLFPKLHIPDSTRRTWLSRGVANVVTLDPAEQAVQGLQIKTARLEKRVVGNASP